MTPDQLEALRYLVRALNRATDTGLLDMLSERISPDTVNAFCDGLAAMESQG